MENNYMRLVHTDKKYNFWVGTDKDKVFYNITPIGQDKPNGGYSSEYICGIKGVKNIFKDL